LRKSIDCLVQEVLNGISLLRFFGAGSQKDLALSPTSHYWKPYSGFEDYGLKWSITFLLQMKLDKEHKKKGLDLLQPRGMLVLFDGF
jgi:hypothetical protein